MNNPDIARPTLILHVGPGKTGTSALQKWLLAHQQQLQSEGIHFPAPANPELFEGNCNDLQLLLRRPERTDGGDYAVEILDWLSKARQELDRHSGNVMIVSNENLANASEYQLGFLKRLAPGYFDLRIIMVAREPYSWFWSAWGQGVKRAGVREEFGPYVRRSMDDYAKAYRPYLNVFDDLWMLEYSRDRLVADFARLLCLDPERYNTADAGKETVNRSMTREELEILISVNRVLRDGALSGRISNYMIRSMPDAKGHMVVYPDLREEIEQAAGPVLERLRAFLPGCGRLPDPTPGASEAADSETISLDRQLLEHVLLAVRAEDASERRFKKLRHMLMQPPEEARYPGQLPADFSAVDYLLLNQDVLRADLDPIEHFLNYGRHEGRNYARNRGE
ncbi:hypothetical protein J3E64_003040 [Sphingobium sp. OAS761]|uniref:hypothetical protein n=1 Tax=Sphingobium sp. OAS761 TaxID=2817901 RepID=UPI00209D30CC|nr:hypothetical protein [Sphingobium sp. OAS761]MCP1471333.1 hypothetical protein [Sphingobium sp. OAS761]